ncbi:hypothetical protein MSG28_013552 [Choristoneura fumiferana]|uniref:Uncharacterized protein n=1 Tax=Choristoneura fumiferana TaxID=7141 RepID=A0ACC0K8K0_CHOFU|nr:hypothetical protein MSG28_013552 [Choristoneura fumiferana]
MSRLVPPTIQQVYIADGFADDCDELIHRCSRVDILSYQTFCIHYKDMNFASVFKGRTSNSEIAELSEELLQIAKYYMVLDTSNFEESVAGLFLVYALLNLQPYPGFAHLRIVPEDLAAIARIEQVARRERRLDVLYILGSVLTKGPVHYHAASRERGMEGAIRKYLEGTCTVDVTGVRPKGVYFRQNEELDIIREMTGIFKRYSKAKEQITGLKKRSLSYCKDNLADDLGASLKRLINGITDTEAEPQSADHYSSVQEIKQRAMRGAVDTVRHLNAADQRSPEKTPRVTAGYTTPKRPIPMSPSSDTRKRNTKAKAKIRKPKRKRHSMSSSSDDSDDSDDWCRKKTSPASATFENTDIDELDGKLNEQEISVEIDALPNLMTTESEGKLVEIEIIDKMKGKRGRPKKNSGAKEGSETEKEIGAKKKEPEADKIEESKELEVKKVTEAKKKDLEAKSKNDDAIFKRPLRMSPRLRKIAKREMKKPILKSKFKKMGMLPIANFEEQK